MLEARETGESLQILHVGECIRGGVATYLREVLPKQVSAFGPDRVGVAVPSGYLPDLGPLPGVRLLPLKYGGRKPAALAAYAYRLRALIRRETPSLLHLHSSFAGLAGRLPLRLQPSSARRPRVVYCSHGWAFERSPGRLGHGWSRWVERALAGVTDAIVNISGAEQQAAVSAGLPEPRCHCILHGVSDLAHTPAAGFEPDPSELNLMFIGRLDRQKGIDLLLDAMARLQGRRIRLYVAGEPLIDDLDLGWPSNVTRLGWLDHERLAGTLAAVDALIVPSRWEGFGMVAVEAMRAGRAVLASRCGGLPEIVRHGETGILFDLSGADALASVIDSLRKEGLAEMGRRGRVRYETFFSADRMNLLLGTLYRSLLAGDDPAATRARLDAARTEPPDGMRAAAV